MLFDGGLEESGGVVQTFICLVDNLGRMTRSVMLFNGVVETGNLVDLGLYMWGVRSLGSVGRFRGTVLFGWIWGFLPKYFCGRGLDDGDVYGIEGVH